MPNLCVPHSHDLAGDSIMKKVYNWKKFLLYVAPITILYTLFEFIPILLAFRYSLTNYRGVGEAVNVGLSNYLRLFQDKLFYRCLLNTLKLTATTVVIVIPLSFIYAFLLEKNTKVNLIHRAVIFAPYTVSGIVVGLIWTFILDPSKGFLNHFLDCIGLDFLAQEWIGGKTLTPFSAGIIGVWAAAGFCTLLWMNGLKQIPTDVIEASIIDGATVLQRVKLIILPLLKETLKMLFVLQFTGCLKTFETVQMLTGGGPNHYSETMVSYMYNVTFTQRLFGYGMAIAVVEFLISMTVTFAFMRLTSKEATE